MSSSSDKLPQITPEQVLATLKCEFSITSPTSFTLRDITVCTKDWLILVELVPKEVIDKFLDKSRIPWLASHLNPKANFDVATLCSCFLCWIAVLDTRIESISKENIYTVYEVS
eukprot:TRINITY_DN2753_c0_g1_i2.p1 TRINITY_DN2753_c0_g1~~TRINITY_DN2753_c0_g1_i2.p1  ORF type:complete len:114 (-),score=12.82 TRINITY_DN2753_c0_g1_i2:293-634(-)